MTANLPAIFRAGSVRRWHCHPELCNTGDRNDGHAARVARIILAMHPAPSLTLVAAALQHDDGESVSGDVPAEAKRRDPLLSDRLHVIETNAIVALWGDKAATRLNEEERIWLKFADRLDAYMWAFAHAPEIMGEVGWRSDWQAILRSAEALGVKVAHLLPSPPAPRVSWLRRMIARWF